MTAAVGYLEALAGRVQALIAQQDTIDAVARSAAASLRDGGVLHVAGTGHSQLVALEAAVRAGGLAAVQAIADPALGVPAAERAAALERIPGYAALVLDASDLRPGEVLVVVSHSGINPVPIELARGGRQRGLTVVALTSLSHTSAVDSRHPDGDKLVDHADLVLDTGAPIGDAIVELDGETRVGPVSTVLGCALLHAVGARTAELLVEQGELPPILASQNLSAGFDANTWHRQRYRGRDRWVG